MEWIHVTTEEQLNKIIEQSQEKPQLIFKHSTRCSISSVALQRLQKAQPPTNIDFYLLDLISYRKISNKIADLFQINHESPQVLLIKEGKCIYDESHLSISMHEIADHLEAA